MSAFHLASALNPKSVALFGASERDMSLGRAIMSNLLKGGFAGDIWPVNPKYQTLFDQPCFEGAGSLPSPPDLAVIATPPHTIADILKDVAKRGTKTVIIITAGLNEIKDQIIQIAHTYGIRLIGPNCLGVMTPSVGLNASFAHLMPHKGKLAFISQSGAILTSVTDWAIPREVGFSHLLSLGNMFDVDIADMLDYLAEDRKTKAILIYMEAIKDAASFMSAARRVTRVKPVIVMKVGRDQKAAKAVMSHTGALAGSDDVYDAAFARAGVVRVNTLEELMDIGELLTHQQAMKGDDITVITNGGGLGIIAADAITKADLSLASLSEATNKMLNNVLPQTWSHANPIDIVGDGGPQRYRAALKIALQEKNSDVILIINCPTSASSNFEIAKAVIEEVKSFRQRHPVHRPILTVWAGDETAAAARFLFQEADIATFETPEDAVNAMKHLRGYAKLQEAILRKPASVTLPTDEQMFAVTDILQKALRDERTVLFEDEAKAVLAAYNIPVAPTRLAKTPEQVGLETAVILADPSYEACVIKIASEDLTHKSDVGGVKLNIKTAKEATDTAQFMLADISAQFPMAKLDGFTVQPMIKFSHSRELIAGIMRDETFGPVIMVGAGGIAVEVLNDKAIDLPPLTTLSAGDMIAKTRISKLIAAYRHVPAVDIEGVTRVLIALSQLACDHPSIKELDINPLIAHPDGVMALDARIGLDETSGMNGISEGQYDHLAIMPYPRDLSEDVHARDGIAYHIRPIVPQDEDLYRPFLEKLTEQDIFTRLFYRKREVSHTFIAQLTHVDYRRDMALVALDKLTGELAGVGRLASTSQIGSSEFAVIVRSDLKGQGIGWLLMEKLISFAESRGIERIVGDVLAGNAAMLKMCHEFGFNVIPVQENPDIYHVELIFTERYQKATLNEPV